MAAPAPANASIPAPASREWLWAALLASAFLALNLATYNSYPVVWCDEVWFSEPSVNLVTEGVFHSRTWLFQPSNTFPTVNCPLYALALVPWLKMAGTSVLAIRSFNYTLLALNAWLVWLAARRFGWIKTPGARLLLVPLLALGYGMSFASRCSRPDLLAMTGLLMLLFAFGIERTRLRTACLLGLSALLVWIGLQVALFAAVACAAAWLLLRRVTLRELVVLGLGQVLGVLSLLLFLSLKGVLVYFLPPIIGILGKYYAHGPKLSPTAAAAAVLRQTVVSYLDDFSTLALMLGLAVLLAAGWRRLSAQTRGLLIYCLALVFGVPALFNLIGHWAFYYSYMRYVPATVAFLAVLSELTSAGSAVQRWVRPLGTAVLAVAMAVGLPMRLALSAACCKLAPRQDTLRIIRAHVGSNDIVLSDHAALFEAKQVARVVYDPYYSSALLFKPIAGSHDFTWEEKRAVNVLVLRPQAAAMLTNFFRGRWEAVSEPFGDHQDFSALTRLPVVGSRIASYAAQPQTERYPLQIFRRVQPSAADH